MGIHGALALTPLLSSAALERMGRCRGKMVFTPREVLIEPCFIKEPINLTFWYLTSVCAHTTQTPQKEMAFLIFLKFN